MTWSPALSEPGNPDLLSRGPAGACIRMLASRSASRSQGPRDLVCGVREPRTSVRKGET